jgi:murein tripeptide amidase MpaA
MTEQEARKVLEKYNSSKYQRYGDITDFLHAWAALYPGLCRLESVGKSAEERDIWSVTLTNFATGDDRSKPAYHINGQHHSGEVTACAVAMYTVQYLLTNYGTDAAVTELLDTRVVYVLPRIAVDGAEWYFEHPQMLRSSPLMYPLEEEPEGLRPMDINGDGMILQMRIPHPQGEWQVSGKDPRLMVRRRPEDRAPSSPDTASLASVEDGGRRDGNFYRLHTEGLIKQRTPNGIEVAYDGRGVTGDPGGPYERARSFDFNRNYPTNWKPQHRQPGSGRYPFDRQEVRAMAEFWLKHPNIGGAMSYHTRSGMNLRPSPLIGDDKLNQTDLAFYKAIGAAAERITGYPTVSVYEYFTANYDANALDVGSWLEWCYDEKGVMGFEMELWDFPYITGVKKRPIKELKTLTDEQREEEALMVLQWVDKELGGKGFTDWTPFEHPQLGWVEIGGYDPKFIGQNPPEQLLHQECHKNCLFTIEHALSLPLLRIGQVRTRQVGEHIFKVEAQVANRGYLPTNVTQTAIKMKETKPVEAALSGDVKIVGGKEKQELGQINGRGSGSASAWGNASSPVTEAWAEWVVQGTPGTAVTIAVKHERGGSVHQQVNLGGEVWIKN